MIVNVSLILVITAFIFSSTYLSGQDNSHTDTGDINSSISPNYSSLQNDYDVEFYFIDLEISNISTFIKGKTSIRLKSEKVRLDTIAFELDSRLTVDSVFVNNIKISEYKSETYLIKIVLPDILVSEEILTASIYYQGYAGSGNYYGGVKTEVDHRYNKSVTYTLSEPFQSSLWFPCKQDLTDKADSAWIFLTVNNGLKAGSNGVLSAINPIGDNKTRFEWKTSYPIAYYLISFSVSDYIDYTFNITLPGKNSSMPVQNYLYNNPLILTTEKEKIDITEDLLILYSELLGDYPFYNEKYGHCLAPMSGGMEHQTMTTLSSFNFDLVAHELAHQWYGNYVTCKTWQDIWINEGFASYLEYIAIEKLRPESEAKDWIEFAHLSAKKELEGSVYIPNNMAHNVSRIFNYELSYKKGAAILHMLRYEINDDIIFFNILRDFLSEYAFKTASGEDFKNFVNTKTGEDFTWFFNQWYYGKGYPLFITSWSQTEDSLIIFSMQETSSTYTPFFQTHMDYRIRFSDGSDENIKVFINEPSKRFALGITNKISSLMIDPENWILKSAVIFDEFKENAIFHFNPNPFINTIHITFYNGLKTRRIRLAGIDGVRIIEIESTSDKLNLDLGFLKQGIYIITITEDNSDYTMKMVKVNEGN